MQPHAPQLMAPIRESAAWTARRLRRRLRDHWPHTRFMVRSDALTQTVTVTWGGGPTEPEVRDVARLHCRTCSPSGGTLWSSPSGAISIVEPLATIALRRT